MLRTSPRKRLPRARLTDRLAFYPEHVYESARSYVRLILGLTILQDWFRILTDPDTPELERMLGVGQLVTWPKVRTSA